MKKNLVFLVCGIILGTVSLIGVRFVTLKSDKVHYHANFALFIDGQPDKFDGPGYYQEIQTCDVHDEDDVVGRAHMHNQNNHIVHVHAHAVTWGAFFENLGYTLGDKVVADKKGVYTDGQDNKDLTFMLNGKVEENVANKLIRSEDTLLINYGKDDTKTLQGRFSNIPKDAHQANVTKDPAACSGDEELTFWNRLKRAVGVGE